jgi:hypothetical protein
VEGGKVSVDEKLLAARQRMQDVEARLDQLKNARPSLLDVSLRENAVGARIGQTLQDKLELFPRLRAFGFRHIILGTLNYALPDEPQVDDDFMRHLRDQGAGLHGCYALVDAGTLDAHGCFLPSPSMLKLQAYRVPNAVLEICLGDEGMAGRHDAASLLPSLEHSIAWLRAHVAGEDGGLPHIILNIVDGCDAFAGALERVVTVLDAIGALALDGVSIEDGRGTFLPFQLGAYVAIARAILPAATRVLVHVHAGAGVENASVIEALLNGADGMWAGLPKRTAVNGHASLGELIANLARVGNPAMHDYRLDQLLPLASSIQHRLDGADLTQDIPILGTNASRLPLSAFRQVAGRPMDLPPEAIGGSYRYRICPVVSDPAVIAGRLAEITGQDAAGFAPPVLETMVRLMRRDLRAGLRIPYDEPEHLLALHRRALATPQQEKEETCCVIPT